MKKFALAAAITVAFFAAGSGLAAAKDGDRDDDDVRQAPNSAPFELEIDPDIDAQFPDRPVNAAAAADIVTRAFGGGTVTEVELEEEGRPYWEVRVSLGGGEVKADVDAFSGQILGAERD
jgi:uncharacterized membrane protein YkoI